MAFRVTLLNDVFRMKNKKKDEMEIDEEDDKIKLETVSYPNAVVHVHYDQTQPPARQDPSTGTWARIICVSDTHNTTFEVPEGDVFLHGGDITNWGQHDHLEHMIKWMKALPHAHKIVIAGNHDLTLDAEWWAKNRESWNMDASQDISATKLLFNPSEEGSVTYLEYESCEIEVSGHKLKIFGSPGSPEFCNWAFMYDRGEEAVELANKIPDDTDIVITHGPPMLVLDRTRGGEAVGCEALAKRIKAIRPKLHLFGHIHESHGAEVKEWKAKGDKPESTTVYVNAACHPQPRGNYPTYQAHKKNRWHMLPVIVDLKLA